MNTLMRNKSLYSILILSSLLCFGGYAQTPYISGISHSSATVNEQIQINGLNFSSTSGDWLVTFGAQSVVADEADPAFIKVTVPSGASTDNLIVTNVNTGLSAYSDQLFYISHGGAANSFDVDKQSGINTVASGGDGAVDICLCDLDQDGDSDMVITHQESTFISVFVNQSTIGNTNITHDTGNPEQRIEIGFTTRNIACADLNGDQYPDLAISSPDVALGDRLIIVQNGADGSISFNPQVEYSIPRVDGTPTGDRRNPVRVVINDLDLDGRPDIAVSMDSEASIDIFRNTSSLPGDIALTSEPQRINVDGAVLLFGMDIKDLNNDGLHDIGVAQANDENLYILQNISEPGSINFRSAEEIEVDGRYQHLKFGDFDRDGFMDVAMTATTQGNVTILQNNTSTAGGPISFSSTPQIITGMGQPWGLDLGDLDGDGDLDIITPSNITSDQSLFVLNNNGSIGGNIFDDPIQIASLESNAKHIKVGDVDGDGRPDYSFTHRASIGANAELGVILNQNCITPQITPGENNMELCAGQLITFDATKTALGVNYVWSDGTDNIQDDPSNQLIDIGAPGTYSVILNDGCFQNSNSVVVSIDPGAFPAMPTVGIPGDVCEGSSIDLTADDNGAPSAVTYHWSGPDGFTSNDQNPVISEATGASAGDYSVYMTEDDRGCISGAETVSVSVISIPNVSIINTDGSVYCNDGSSIDLSVTDVSDKGTFDIEWQLDGVALDPPETGLTYNVTTPGSYTVIISDGGACSKSTAEEPILEVDPPTISFESDDSKCVDNNIDFSATSIGQLPFTHDWEFGDGSSDQGSNVTYAYSSPDTFTVTLNSTYTGVNEDNCVYVPATKDIVIAEPPIGAELDLIRNLNGESIFEKCPSGAVRLQVINGPYEENGIYWVDQSTLDTLANVDEFRADTEQTIYAAVTDIIGCEYETDPVSITNLLGSGISISSSSNSIVIDEQLRNTINMDEGQTFVELTVENYADSLNPEWTPANIFDDPTLVNVKAFPVRLEESILVTATDRAGCVETDSVTLFLPPLQADKSFSPNGDGINDCWEISGVYGSTCEVTIFDGKGRYIKSLSTTADQLNQESCVWDGTGNGSSQMPPGVYYYILKCSGDNPLNNGGTILLAR